VAGPTDGAREPQVGFVASGVRFLIRSAVSLLPPRRSRSPKPVPSPYLAIKYLAEDMRTFVWPVYSLGSASACCRVRNSSFVAVPSLGAFDDVRFLSRTQP
jgi:hypothetical protein